MEELIQTGKKRKAVSLALHGVHGIGKTTFGTKVPHPIFISGEENEEIDSARFPKCRTWPEFLKYLEWVRDTRHPYKSLVIDTLDSIENLLWKHILDDDRSDDMATARGGFGKGYTYATQKFTEMRDEYLVPIRERGINIILLCHSAKNKIEDPLTLATYDKQELKLYRNGKGMGTYTVISEWVTIILFANFVVHTVKDKNSAKEYAVGEGERRMFTNPRPAYDAKNRYGLPHELPLEWNVVEEGIDRFYGLSKEEKLKILRKEVFEMTGLIKDQALREKTITNLNSKDKVNGLDEQTLTKARAFIQGVLK